MGQATGRPQRFHPELTQLHMEPETHPPRGWEVTPSLSASLPGSPITACCLCELVLGACLITPWSWGS